MLDIMGAINRKATKFDINDTLMMRKKTSRAKVNFSQKLKIDVANTPANTRDYSDSKSSTK
jgi:hypothetical protein